MSTRFMRFATLLLVLILVSSFPLMVFAQGDDEPVTRYAYSTTNLSSLDPQLATDQETIYALENLFLGLTDFHPETLEIVPELATDWTFDAEDYTWTFTIRDDVPWVQWDPVADEGTVLRNVTAGDFVTGIRRACDPNNTSQYAETTASMIAGCEDVFSMEPDAVTPEDFEMVQVSAPDDTTLVVTLVGPVGHFFSTTPMWMLRAVPGEIIDEYGDEWTEPGNIVTNGAYVIDEWTRGVRTVYLRNPFLPEDMRGPGNVERRINTRLDDSSTIYALYLDNQFDTVGVPGAELQNVLNDPEASAEVLQTARPSVAYVGFAHDKPPFDNVHVRRAFSAAINREVFISEVRQGRGIPMMHFTPPGMFGAVPVNEAGIDGEGIGYDPEYAYEELETAGYPACEGMPEITILLPQGGATWGEYIQAEVENVLGCDPGIFTIEQVEFITMLDLINPATPTEERPNMWTGLGWSPDYPDANNWVFDAGLHCESGNDFMRPCGEVDELINEAQVELDPARRAELYAEIEEMFFGYDGEHPIIALYMSVQYTRVRPWVTGPFETDGLFGGIHYDWTTIDQEMQLEARGG